KIASLDIHVQNLDIDVPNSLGANGVSYKEADSSEKSALDTTRLSSFQEDANALAEPFADALPLSANGELEIPVNTPIG
ncbi:MAG TPA: hypothetical protein PLZ51_29120, partial [Aggregatilineales bacterium]|nr:hypothetical protein [Aggregatilineales bacterium]